MELLVVIAVIGIMCAIAIPMFSQIRENADIRKNQHNAQNIVSVAMAAHVAGAELDTTSIADLVKQLSDGVSVMVAGSPAVFQLSALSDGEISGAAPYIVLGDGYVSYSTTPVP